ncbi:acyltransferase [Macrococcus equi]|uniref:acyltransferase n=1 Tax=Macrococcus equi TaxID=3395462 RepID=UPI0039BDE713
MKKILNRITNRYISIAQARQLGVEIGRNSRFLNVNKSTFGSEPFLVKLGDHVTITNGVKFVTHDGGVWVFREKNPNIDIFGPIIVGNNVFIGINSILLPNVTIGDNVVIAAGSVVTKSFPDNCVIGGNPATIIKSIDEYESKVMKNAEFVRDYPLEEKRTYLTNKYIRGIEK